MNVKKSLKDVIVLVAICVVFGTILAVVNSITAPIIAERLEGAANQAYEAVMPGAAGFENVDLTGHQLPASVKEAKRETSGMGYAIKLEVKGYDNGMIIIVGVSSEGVVTGATCIESKETNGVEKSYGENFLDKDIDGVKAVNTVAGSTLTSSAYRSAVVDAINAATILGGGSADLRSEEEIVADTLPAAEGKFTLVSVIDSEGQIYSNDELSIKNLYKADNGAGYVCVVGKEYVAFDSEGNYLTEISDEGKATVDNVISLVNGSVFTEVDLSTFEGISSLVTSVKVNDNGVYVINVNGEGYGIKGDMDGYTQGNGEYIRLCLTVSADGKLVDIVTVSHSETIDFVGDLLVDGKYNTNFVGKDKTEAGNVSIVAGCTLSSSAYKEAVNNAFNAYTIIVEGGAANE